MIGNAADALAAYARIEAARKLIADETERLHHWLRDEAADIGEQTGTAASFKSPAGQAQWTQPTFKVTVDDEAAFGKWAEQSGHPVAKRLEVDCSILQRDLDSDDPEAEGPGWWLTLRGLLEEHGYLRERWGASTVLLEEMEAWPVHLGEVVSPLGEPVPGVRKVPRSNPSFRITANPKVVQAEMQALRNRLAGVLALPETTVPELDGDAA